MDIVKRLKKNKLLILVFLTYLVLLIVRPEKAIQSSKNSVYYIIEMFEIMPVVFILTSLIEAWVPRDTIINSFGENSGIKGSVYSFLLGSFSAGPIYAAFPICKMLLKKGASISNIVIILSTWAVIKVPMLVNEAKFLGTKFMVNRWVFTTIAIFLMAYIVSKLVKKKDIVDMKEESKEKGNIDIKQQYCIGCGLCVKLSPDNFKLSYGKAVVTKNEITPDAIEGVKDAIKRCPARAIDLN